MKIIKKDLVFYIKKIERLTELGNTNIINCHKKFLIHESSTEYTIYGRGSCQPTDIITNLQFRLKSSAGHYGHSKIAKRIYDENELELKKIFSSKKKVVLIGYSIGASLVAYLLYRCINNNIVKYPKNVKCILVSPIQYGTNKLNKVLNSYVTNILSSRDIFNVIHPLSKEGRLVGMIYDIENPEEIYNSDDIVGLLKNRKLLNLSLMPHYIDYTINKLKQILETESYLK